MTDDTFKSLPKKVVILHGTLGDSKGNWFQWLRSELEKRGVEVWLPDLPEPSGPSLQKWSDYVIRNCPFAFDQDTALVGHSSGAITVLTVAQLLPQPVQRIVSVAAFKDNDFLQWEPNNRLFDMDFDFTAIARNCSDILFIHSDDDPYCPLEHAEYLAENTGGKLMVIPSQGHFNIEKSEKYHQFEHLLRILGAE